MPLVFFKCVYADDPVDPCPNPVVSIFYSSNHPAVKNTESACLYCKPDPRKNKQSVAVRITSEEYTEYAIGGAQPVRRRK